jgi:hypothetical protein
MIGTRLSSKDRKTAFIGGTVILALVVVSRVAPAWYHWRSDAQQSATLARSAAFEAAATLRRRPKLGAAVKRAELEKMEVEPAFLDGRSTAVATANLASVVADAAAESGMRIATLETSDPLTKHEIRTVQRVGVRGEAAGDVRSVTEFLAILEERLPLIAVRELSVAQEQSAASEGRLGYLRVGFVIEGLARSDLPPQSK